MSRSGQDATLIVARVCFVPFLVNFLSHDGCFVSVYGGVASGGFGVIILG